VIVREATVSDLPRIVALLAQLYADPAQEDYAAEGGQYQRAYAEIAGDPGRRCSSPSRMAGSRAPSC